MVNDNIMFVGRILGKKKKICYYHAQSC